MRPALLAVLGLASAVFARAPMSGGIFLEISRPAISIDLATEGDAPDLHYDANSEPQVGFDLRYGRYILSLAPSLFGEGSHYPDRPATRHFDLKGGYFGDQWAFEGYHQYFRGFHLVNEGEYEGVNASSLRLWTTDVNVYRTIGSSSRMYRVVEGIAKTGFKANWYGLASVSRIALRSPFGLLQDDPQANGTLMDSLGSLTANTLTAGFGATLNANLGGFYIDPTLMLALGPQYRAADADIDPWSAALKVNLKLNLGYANERFDVGLQVQNDANDVDFGSTALLFHSIVSRIAFRVTL